MYISACCSFVWTGNFDHLQNKASDKVCCRISIYSFNLIQNVETKEKLHEVHYLEKNLLIDNIEKDKSRKIIHLSFPVTFFLEILT